MSERAAYSRVYWSVMDDPKFDGIREDARTFGSWTILLIAADMAWPAPAYVPSTVPRSCYRALVTAGIVDELTGGRFRIHGLDAERGRRRDAATRPGSSRHPTGTQLGPKRDPNGEQDETRRDELRQDEQNARTSDDRWDAPEQEALVWLSKHGCDVRPGNGYHQKLITAVEVHGVNAMVGMLDRLAGAGTANGDIKGYLFGAIDALNARTRPSLVALEKDDQAERAEGNAARQAERTLRQLHENGSHEMTAHPRCPLCQRASA